jgi:hypothetical protein
MLWVGVSPTLENNPRLYPSQVVKANDAIVRATCELQVRGKGVDHEFTNGSSCVSIDFGGDVGEVVDLYDTLRSRIGFGVRVQYTAHGIALKPKVAAWLRSIGVLIPVTVWAWSPYACYTRRVKK